MGNAKMAIILILTRVQCYMEETHLCLLSVMFDNWIIQRITFQTACVNPSLLKVRQHDVLLAFKSC